MAKRIAVDDPIDKRVEMVNGMFQLPGETLLAMKDVREASELYARTLQAIFKRGKIDIGRAIATIDHIQLTKNLACDALILPHASKAAE